MVRAEKRDANGVLQEIQEDGETVWNRNDERKEVADAIVEEIDADTPLNDPTAVKQRVHDRLKGGN